MRSSIVLVAAFLLVTSCTFIRDFDGFDTGSDAAPDPVTDSGAVDAGGDGGDAGADASSRQNLRDNGDFETGCGGWTTFHATLSTSDVPHSGLRSCRVCVAAGTGTTFSAGGNDIAVVKPPIGSEYRAEAWIRKDPARATSGTAGLLLRTTIDDPFTEVEKTFNEVGVPDDMWRKVSSLLSVTESATSLRLSVSAVSTTDGCFLVDDVVLVRSK